MMKLAVDKACHKANRRLASLQCSGSGAMEEEEMELQFGGTFSMSLGGCAPGKSAPTSTTVRLVCVLASEGWANSGQVSGTQLQGGRQSLKPPPSLWDWFPQHPIIISPHQITTLLENWVVWFVFPLVFHFYSTLSYQYRVLWTHILYVVMFSSLVQNWKTKMAAKGPMNSRRCYLEVQGLSHSPNLGSFRASKR